LAIVVPIPTFEPYTARKDLRDPLEQLGMAFSAVNSFIYVFFVHAQFLFPFFGHRVKY
jgi:hypothetical protein